MNSGELKERTKRLAVRVMEFTAKLPSDDASRIVRNQLIRSATSVAANYRAACRARSRSDFINKLGIVEEEADETVFWLEMLEETKRGSTELTNQLMREFRELTAIFTASRKTAKRNRLGLPEKKPKQRTEPDNPEKSAIANRQSEIDN